MKLPVHNKPFTWSPTQLKTFNTCPVKYWGTHCDPKKEKFKDTEASIWGRNVHKAFEIAVKENVWTLPAPYAVYQKWLDGVRQLPGDKIPEQKMGMNRLWQGTTFFAKDVWLRLIVDLINVNGDTACIFDYKTGKSRYDDDNQLMLGMIVTSVFYPSVTKFKAGYIYLKEDKVTRIEASLSEVDSYKIHFQTLLEPMVNCYTTGIFKPTPNGLCRKWCDVKTCPHNGNYS